MKLSEIHHLAVGVADLERSLEFYEGVLGLRCTLRMPVGGADAEQLLGLAPGTTGRSAYVQGPRRIGQLELIEWAPRRPREATRGGETGPFLIAFELLEGELEECRQRLEQRGIEFVGPQVSIVENYGPIEAIVTTDPDGTMVELLRLPSDEEVRAFRASGGEGR